MQENLSRVFIGHMSAEPICFRLSGLDVHADFAQLRKNRPGQQGEAAGLMGL